MRQYWHKKYNFLYYSLIVLFYSLYQTLKAMWLSNYLFNKYIPISGLLKWIFLCELFVILFLKCPPCKYLESLSPKVKSVFCYNFEDSYAGQFLISHREVLQCLPFPLQVNIYFHHRVILFLMICKW